jgi:peroxiredoxin family protein
MTTTSPAIVPKFDSEDSNRKLAIICSKGNLDMAYPGLIMGNAALGEGIETLFFFTFWGFDMITKSRMYNLQFSPAGNTAMHLPGRDAHTYRRPLRRHRV